MNTSLRKWVSLLAALTLLDLHGVRFGVAYLCGDESDR